MLQKAIRVSQEVFEMSYLLSEKVKWKKILRYFTGIVLFIDVHDDAFMMIIY